MVEHAGIGVQLLWQLVSEMNQLTESDATLTLTKHRKIASSFRDVHLYEIFQLSCTLLRNALENFRNMNFEDQGQVLIYLCVCVFSYILLFSCFFTRFDNLLLFMLKFSSTTSLTNCFVWLTTV